MKDFLLSDLGRKFIVLILFAVVISIGFFMDRIDAQLYIATMLGIQTSFNVANVAEKFTPVLGD